jgi:RNA polymerase sigma-70 factor (family 1)
MQKNFTFILKNIANHNDQESFGMLFDHFYPQLFRYSLYYVRQPHFAEEVISDVFYKLLTNNKELREIKNIGYYLYKAVKNQSLTFLRDQKNKISFGPITQEEDYFIAGTSDPENQLIDKESLLLVEEAVNKLPAQRQLVFRLIREEGMNYKEVADLLNISPRTVETHLGLAIKDLCQLLKLYIHSKNSGDMSLSAGKD